MGGGVGFGANLFPRVYSSTTGPVWLGWASAGISTPESYLSVITRAQSNNNNNNIIPNQETARTSPEHG